MLTFLMPRSAHKSFSSRWEVVRRNWAEGKCAEISYEALPKALVETIVLEYDSLFWTNDGINIPSFSLQGSIAQSIARNATRSIGNG